MVMTPPPQRRRLLNGLVCLATLVAPLLNKRISEVWHSSSCAEQFNLPAGIQQHGHEENLSQQLNLFQCTGFQPEKPPYVLSV